MILKQSFYLVSRVIQTLKFDYRKIKVKVKEKYINEKLSQLPISMKLKQFKRDDLLMAFDATSLYPSAMYDENSIYPKIETGYAFTENMNDELVNELTTKINHEKNLNLIIGHQQS